MLLSSLCSDILEGYCEVWHRPGLTQDSQGPFPRLESDPPPEKVLKLGEEAGEVIGGGVEKSDEI